MKRTTIFGLLSVSVAMLAAAAGAAVAQTVGSVASDVPAAGSRTRETAAGNLVADAVRAAVNADVAIVAADALTEGSLSQGPVTRDALKAILSDPEDEVAVLELTGAQLKVVLQRSVSVYPRPFDGFLQVSGLTVVFNARPSADRNLDIRVKGAALDANRKYRVGTLSTLAGGALGYFRLWTEKDVTGGGPAVLDALAGYIQAQGEVNPRVEGRIKTR